MGYALAMDGAGGHCSGHVSSLHAAHDGHHGQMSETSVEMEQGVGTDDHGNCDPHLCQAVALSIQHNAISYGLSGEVIAVAQDTWRPLGYLENPDRPPNS